MREIKFRGISEDEWVYGMLLKTEENDYGEHGDEHFNYLIQTNETNMGEYVQCYITDNKTIGQYTGLKDKMEKEIYEGDIVQYIYYKYSNDDFGHKGFYKRLLEIYYDETNMKFDYKFIKSEEIEMPKDYKEPYMEVIGNIYENPELLEE